MRRAAMLVLLTLAAACWVAAGPGGLTVRALLACAHETMPMSHHGSMPSDAPCFCDHMTVTFDLAVSPAAPAPVAPEPLMRAPVVERPDASRFPLPPSPVSPPVSPPPNGLA